MRDFYEGFEGEPEIHFVAKVKGVPDQVLRIWDGYFDSIMARIELKGGQWTGLALPYHLCEGWHDAPWKIESLDSVVDQWRQIRTDGLPAGCGKVHVAILELLTSVDAAGGEVWISEE
ncbi:hypothetical protein D7Y27_22245 [Corallococcus sp. AB004]|nr:hypothetical protein D7Y27_22245 [Corallococcus sp. AB004]